MSEQNKIDVQAVLNTQSLLEQLNKQKLKIKVDIDSAYLGNQIQSMVNQSVGGLQPVKIPIEADTGGIKPMEVFNQITSGINAISVAKNSIDYLKQGLD